MILTVDIGNSRIKWAQWQAGVIVARAVTVYKADKKLQALDRLFPAVEKPSRVFAVCVAGDDMQLALSAWVKQHWQLDVEYLQTEKRYNNIINAYKDPQRHGADRWAAVVAAHQSCPGFSVCIISAGTAITFDLVDKNGQHLGGYILPSYATMHSALLADTADIESTFNVQFEGRNVPDNTNDAVNFGLHKLLQAGIRELCQLAQDEMGEPMKIMLTGGFAETILDYPDMPVMQHEPDLVMQGVCSIMNRPER